MVILTPIKEYFAPIFIMVHHGELIGVVEVDLHHQAVGHYIYRHCIFFHRLIYIGIGALNYQAASCIIPTRGTYGINECLLIGYDCFYYRCIHFILRLLSRLVASGKKQMFVISIEFGGNLCPQCLLFGIHLTAVTVHDTFFEPAAIPVDIDDGIHIIGYAIAHHLAYPVEPCSIYLIRRLIDDIRIPRTRYAHCIESQLLQTVDICLAHLGISPSRFISGHLQRVAYIYTGIHLGSKRLGITAHTVAFSPGLHDGKMPHFVAIRLYRNHSFTVIRIRIGLRSNCIFKDGARSRSLGSNLAPVRCATDDFQRHIRFYTQ